MHTRVQCGPSIVAGPTSALGVGLLAVTILAASAETACSAPPYVSLSAGWARSELVETDQDIDESLSGVTAGILLGVPVKRPFSVETGLELAPRGGTSVKGTYDPTYLSVPVQVRYRLFPGKFGLTTGAGLSVDFPLETDFLRKPQTDVSGRLLLGGGYEIDPDWGLEAVVSYHHGFRDVTRDGVILGPSLEPTPDGKHRAVEVRLVLIVQP